MEDYVKDTLTAYPYWITMLLFVGISAFINYLIVYSKEKARRRVEEETAARITKEIESVKDSYNKALEIHKIELKKEFESARHIIELCKNLDKELIILLSICKSEIEKETDIFIGGEKYASIPHILKLHKHLTLYESRYIKIKHVDNIMEICTEISWSDSDLKTNHQVDYINFSIKLDALDSEIIQLLSLLLPELILDKPEQ